MQAGKIRKEKKKKKRKERESEREILIPRQTFLWTSFCRCLWRLPLLFPGMSVRLILSFFHLPHHPFQLRWVGWIDSLIDLLQLTSQNSFSRSFEKEGLPRMIKWLWQRRKIILLSRATLSVWNNPHHGRQKADDTRAQNGRIMRIYTRPFRARSVAAFITA